MNDTRKPKTLSVAASKKETSAIVELLKRDRENLLERWVEAIRDEFDQSQTTSDGQLKDHMLMIIDAVIGEFEKFKDDPDREKSTEKDEIQYNEGDVEDGGGGVKHGQQRASINAYNVDKVYWEYVLLRKIITNHLQKNDHFEIDHLEIVTCVIEQCARDSILKFTDTVQNIQHKLLSSIIHDIRSPLNLISMMSELAKIDRQSLMAPDFANKLSKTSERISRMLEDMLLTLSAEAGQGLDLIFKRGNLSFLFSAIALESQSLFGNRLKLSLPDQEIITNFDEAIFRRVLENLISNAFKYGDRSGEVSFILSQSDHLILIEVHNFGEPIAQDRWHEIFKFMKRYEGQDETQQSWGIGLAFVKAAVEGHGGKISLSSDSEKGTSFLIELPKDNRDDGQTHIVYL